MTVYDLPGYLKFVLGYARFRGRSPGEVKTSMPVGHSRHRTSDGTAEIVEDGSSMLSPRELKAVAARVALISSSDPHSPVRRRPDRQALS